MPGGEGSGGDSDGERAEETAVAPPRRGFDAVAVLAWIGAILFVVALPVASVMAVVAIGSRNPEIADRFASFRNAFAGPDDEVLATPLPGHPPRSSREASSGDDASDRPEPRVKGRPVVIGNPAWVVRPSGRFPSLAREQGVRAGKVDLQCPVEADGTISSCWILSETPAGAGFGQAAVNAAVRARLTPRTIDGVPTKGMVRFAITFRME